MTRASLAIASAFVIVAMLLGAVLAVGTLPPNVCASFPWHRACGSTDLVDRLGGIFFIPGVTAALTLAFLTIPDWEGKGRMKRRALLTGWAAILLLAAVAQATAVASALSLG
jgi:hypothetical protein